MPVFASFVALSGRIMRSNGYKPEWVNDLLSTITYGASFSDSVQADAVPSPTYTVSSGSLPSGLSLNASTGAVTGTANTEGNYSWTIRATNAIGFIEKAFSQTVGTAPSWSDTTLSSSLTQGTAYSDSVSATAVPSPTYTVSSGSLPPGLSLNSSTGAVTGTPSSGGNYSFTISASNGLGTVSTAYSRSVTRTYTVGYYVVAGGGAGGSSNNRSGGGGGAGGVRTSTSFTAVGGTAYTVSVGGGGAKPVYNSQQETGVYGQTGGQGGNSTFANITSTGGGGGSVATGATGGSGGGGGGLGNYAGGSGTSGQGTSGGAGAGQFLSGGGGGKGGSGHAGNAAVGGEGNANNWATTTQTASFSVGEVSGSNTYFASGGAGSQQGTAKVGGGGNGASGNAAARTGGGGGGNYGAFAHTYGGNGGSGVILIRTLASDSQPTFSGGLSVVNAVNGSYRVYAVKSGSGTVTWPS